MSPKELASYLESVIDNGAFDCLNSEQWATIIKALSVQPEGAELLREAVPLIAGINHEKAINLERRIVAFLGSGRPQKDDQ